MGDIYNIDNLPSEFIELNKVMTEMAGASFKVTNTQLCEDIAYGIITRKYLFNDSQIKSKAQIKAESYKELHLTPVRSR